jgi:hypothetical protein
MKGDVDGLKNQIFPLKYISVKKFLEKKIKNATSKVLIFEIF